MRRFFRIAFIHFVLVSAFIGCSSVPYKTQQYAKLSNSKVFEEERDVVWKAALSALEDYKIKEVDQEKGKLLTDWIYSTSTEKYAEYEVNGFPRKHYMQTRYQFEVLVEDHIGGVQVVVKAIEQVEGLNSDGTFDNWENASEPDFSRAHEILKSIELKILSRPNL